MAPEVDPEIEEGGGHTYSVGGGAAHAAHSCLCACSTQLSMGVWALGAHLACGIED